MAMVLSKRARTADDLEAIPADGNRYEIIGGELIVSPAPSWMHQRALLRLVLAMAEYAESVGIELLFAPVDVRACATTQVEPDLIAFTRVEEGCWTTRWLPMTRMLLTVEILSPSTAPIDRGLKRRLYQAQRVPSYWIVDVDERRVEVWTADAQQAQMVTGQLVWHPLPSCGPLLIDLPAMFRQVHGE